MEYVEEIFGWVYIGILKGKENKVWKFLMIYVIHWFLLNLILMGKVLNLKGSTVEIASLLWNRSKDNSTSPFVVELVFSSTLSSLFDNIDGLSNKEKSLNPLKCHDGRNKRQSCLKRCRPSWLQIVISHLTDLVHVVYLQTYLSFSKFCCRVNTLNLLPNGKCPYD